MEQQKSMGLPARVSACVLCSNGDAKRSASKLCWGGRGARGVCEVGNATSAGSQCGACVSQSGRGIDRPVAPTSSDFRGIISGAFFDPGCAASGRCLELS